MEAARRSIKEIKPKLKEVTHVYNEAEETMAVAAAAAGLKPPAGAAPRHEATTPAPITPFPKMPFSPRPQQPPQPPKPFETISLKQAIYLREISTMIYQETSRIGTTAASLCSHCTIACNC